MGAEKKRIEAYMLAAARNAGVPIPTGETPGEEPDFRFNSETPGLGIELSEVLRPASSNHGILPVEQESFHKDIITKAQHDYYDAPDAKPAHVSVYFTNTKGKRRNKGELACALTEFVKAKVHRASPFVSLYRPETPDGFDSIVISIESREWWCGEGGGYTLDDIRPQVAARISDKDKLVPTYRANLPTGANVWLLLYTGVTVARSMMIPRGIEAWKFLFRFDRVFWFTALEGRFAEIQRVPRRPGENSWVVETAH
ncbi:MAG TPA: hypothetical protein VJO53_04600 [Candidatus Acidoferrales bacterium]|nr:hypothetical protein [Candidatus Acidoferrales bacterium]